ncbi:hypothetical protein SUGI_1140830 [Cryptomeria japonica]|nr:hypothetical protein SUGI_1140830 [Cryptomeria japonica]
MLTPPPSCLNFCLNFNGNLEKRKSPNHRRKSPNHRLETAVSNGKPVSAVETRNGCVPSRFCVTFQADLNNELARYAKTGRWCKAGKYVWLTYQEAYELSIQIGSGLRSCNVSSGSFG